LVLIVNPGGRKMKAEDLDFLREFLIRLLSNENYDTIIEK
jgi:hypothetical protein